VTPVETKELVLVRMLDRRPLWRRGLTWAQKPFKKRSAAPPVPVICPPRFDGPWNLGHVLFRLSECPEDAWTLRDALTGLIVFGDTGAGKTSTSLRKILRSQLRYGLGMLIPCVKKSDAEMYVRHAQECGRGSDVILVGPGHAARYNFLRDEAARPGAELETLVHLLNRLSGKDAAKDGVQNAQFFKGGADQIYRNAIELLQFAEEPVDVIGFSKILRSYARSREEVSTEEWHQRSHVAWLIRKATQLHPRDERLGRVMYYWMKELPGTYSGQRDAFASNVSVAIDPLTRGRVSELFQGESNVGPELLFEGKIIIIDVPIKEHFEAASLCGKIWLLMAQCAIERRKIDLKTPTTTRPVSLFLDECENYAMGKLDVDFQSTCRSQLCPVTRAIQSFNFLEVAYGNATMAKSIAEMMVTKVFHAVNGDTVKYGVELIGNTLQLERSLNGNGKDRSENVHESSKPDCPPWEFTSLERAQEPDFTSEAIVYQSGRRWGPKSEGKNRGRWVKVTFSPK
jgi:type IV secretory pathway TraG/TraD family ATPase VirD4